MRASIMRHTAAIFDPDLFIVDKEPLGLRGEVRPTLELMRARGVPSVLGLRDIMDEPGQLEEEWQRKHVMPALEERRAIGARGRNWLVFGHRNYTHDFLYQLEWQDLLKRGVLTRLDVAFSRDQPEKRYVQHALWDARQELAAWVHDGAAIYVCGDANAMAKDVHATLQRILGDEALDALRRDKRYLRDVY